MYIIYIYTYIIYNDTLHIHMFTYSHIYIYLYIYIIYIYTYIHTYIRTYVRTYIHTYIQYIHTWKYTCILIYIYIGVCIVDRPSVSDSVDICVDIWHACPLECQATTSSENVWTWARTYLSVTSSRSGHMPYHALGCCTLRTLPNESIAFWAEAQLFCRHSSHRNELAIKGFWAICMDELRRIASRTYWTYSQPSKPIKIMESI